MNRLLIGGIAALAIASAGPPVASAQPPEITNCTTSVMNHGLDSYTYCTYTDDSGSYRIVTTCLSPRYSCTTRRAH